MIVHVIDDDEVIRETLGILLRGEGFEPQTYASAAEFLARVDANTQGCIVTDVQLPGVSGIDLIVSLRQRGVTLPVVVITGHANLSLAVEAMKRGAADFIEKPCSAAALLAAIRGACAHVEQAAEPPDLAATRENLAKLTAREKEVLIKLISGLPNKLIAYDMGLSVRTVDSHRAAVKKKMGGGSLAELVRKCLAIGLLGAKAPGRNGEATNGEETRPHH
ncbi:two-component system response regulator FixJ [Rhodoblastus acidophilus]|uniref:response regulator transcription factor n=1 Tax=Rhodoblastus acidophilus TaxID=1074 RepID=UPI0022248B3E|nr:response regulator [Rhodoblastus acidophilus]MCW2285891.1 two-component system response regulator FixJ [Rhodoblastus acidophilus]MCW2334808.1 two-component system response regulator FixJ [Rhodoblastus acidophilus]